MVVLLHAFEWPKVTSFTEYISNIHIEHETASAKYNVKNKQFTLALLEELNFPFIKKQTKKVN